MLFTRLGTFFYLFLFQQDINKIEEFSSSGDKDQKAENKIRVFLSSRWQYEVKGFTFFFPNNLTIYCQISRSSAFIVLA